MTGWRWKILSSLLWAHAFAGVMYCIAPRHGSAMEHWIEDTVGFLVGFWIADGVFVLIRRAKR